MAHAYFRGCDAEEATRPVHVPWWIEPGTARWVLWEMTHRGQIGRLRA